MLERKFEPQGSYLFNKVVDSLNGGVRVVKAMDKNYFQYFNAQTNEELENKIDKKGYRAVRYNKAWVKSHKFIVLAFEGPFKKGWNIHHIDGVKANNHPSNLIAIPAILHKTVHELQYEQKRRMPREEVAEMLKDWNKIIEIAFLKKMLTNVQNENIEYREQLNLPLKEEQEEEHIRMNGSQDLLRSEWTEMLGVYSEL